MGTVLNFLIPARGATPTPAGAEMGKLLLFTGVQYERAEKDETPNPPAKRVRSRRRT